VWALWSQPSSGHPEGSCRTYGPVKHGMVSCNFFVFMHCIYICAARTCFMLNVLLITNGVNAKLLTSVNLYTQYWVTSFHDRSWIYFYTVSFGFPSFIGLIKIMCMIVRTDCALNQFLMMKFHGLYGACSCSSPSWSSTWMCLSESFIFHGQQVIGNLLSTVSHHCHKLIMWITGHGCSSTHFPFSSNKT
jgi:hypothetical protein